VSGARAKKKQRRREREGRPAAQVPAEVRAQRAQERAAARAGAGGGGDRGGAGAAAAADPPARHPSRLEVRDGIPRPDAVWAPFPLTELGMAAGIGLFLLGFVSGGSRGAWLLTIGIVMLSVVVAELCLREHFAGFRSHSVLLGLLPVTAAHMLVVLAITRAWRGPLVLVADLAAAGALAWWLRGRFADAQDAARRRLAA
jgi:hypothetical protein